MKHNVKLLLLGLLPIPVGYLRNKMLVWGITLYPLLELVCLVGWGYVAYLVCDPRKNIWGQSACLCAAGAPALILAWFWTYGATDGLPLAVSVTMQNYFNPFILLFSGNVGRYFYTLMGEKYNMLPVFAASWLAMILASLFGMWRKKKQ